MPIPSLLILGFAFGVGASIASRRELRVQPRPALLSRSFFAFMMFTALVLVPVSVYFYLFHGDWSLLYLVPTERIPSAVALVAFMLQAAIAAFGFNTGAALVRLQRDLLAVGLVVLSFSLAAVVVIVWQKRLSMVGSYAQWNGGFGLVPYGFGPVFRGTVVMGVLLLGGFAYLVTRLWLGARKSP